MADKHPATIERVEAALANLAQLVTKNDRYMPVFERLLIERDAMHKKQDLLSRAHAILADRIPSRNRVGGIPSNIMSDHQISGGITVLPQQV